MFSSTHADQFHALHHQASPLVLTNIWDAGSALSVEMAGAPALATGSASVAEANGYEDGEDIPFELLVAITERIVRRVSVPLSVDMEGGFASDTEALATNISKLINVGAVGINIEDQLIGQDDLRPIDDQVSRLTAIRKQAEAMDCRLFINARTDVFLREPDQTQHKSLLAEAIERAQAYTTAGASGIFAPGLKNAELIAELAARVDLPLNILAMDLPVNPSAYAELGVSRLSAGPAPFRRAMAHVAEEAKAALA